MAFATRLTPAMAARWRGAGLWSDETFASVLARRVRAAPDREALTDGTRRVSYRELATGIDRMAARLGALGIGAGDVVTIQLPNWIEFAFVFFALERLGAVAVTVSVDFRSRELEYIMRFAGSKMFICCAQFRGFDHAAMAAELKPRLVSLVTIGVIGGTAPPGMVRLDDDVAARGAPAGFAPVAMDADTVMRMAFTSGTTGNPKGVMHSHNTTLAAARILNGDLGLSADDVMMIWLPLGLNWGYLTLVQAVLAGAKAVLLDRFTPAAALDLIARERVTYIPTAPASLTAILEEPDLDRRDLSSLRFVVSGGASAPLETIRAWRQAVLASEASGQRGHSISARAGHSPEPGSSARAVLASEASGHRGHSISARAGHLPEPGSSARAVLASEASGHRGHSISARAGHLPEPGSSARAVLASEASGQRGHSISARAGHSPEPGSSARAVLASEASGHRGHSISARAGHLPEPGSSARAAPGVLLELLGMLETGYQAYTRPSDDPERVAGSVGVPASHMGLRLIDGDGRDVPPGEEGEILLRRSLRASRLSQQSRRQRRGVPARWLVPQRRSRRDRCGRAPAHRRSPQGDDQPRRQEVLPARDRGGPLYPSAGALRRDRRHSGRAARGAQLPVLGAAPRRAADARWHARLPRRQRGDLQAAGAAGAVRAISVHPDRQDPAPCAGARRAGAHVGRRLIRKRLEKPRWMTATHAFRGC